MKQLISQNASVIKDSNRVMSDTETDWSVIRAGSFFRFIGDNSFYTVAKSHQIFYIKDFEVLSNQKLTIKSDLGINLAVGDIITLSYKEYELLTVMGLLDGGKGYKVDDVITLDGGTAASDTISGIFEKVSLNVTDVGGNGEITGLGLGAKGRYTKIPPKPFVVSGGHGKGAIVDCEFKLLEDRKLVDRTITYIDGDRTKGEFYIDYPLPEGIATGKLSCNKWEILLTGPYVGESKLNVQYDVSRDFTPNLRLPLAALGSNSTELIHNTAMFKLDAEVQELREAIAFIREKFHV